MTFQRRFLPGHRAVLFTVFIALVATILGATPAFLVTRAAMERVALRVIERDLLYTSEVFHTRTEDIVKNFFFRGLQTVELLATESTLREYLAEGNLTDAELILERQRRIGSRFDTITISDQEGTNIVASSKDPDARKSVGQNFRNRDFFVQPMTRKQPYLSTVFRAGTGKDVITFAAPMLDETGQVTHVISGGMQLESLRELLTLDSPFGEFHYLVTDREGNDLLHDRGESTTPEHDTEINRALSALVAGAPTSHERQPGTHGEQVIAKGSRIDLGNENAVLDITYFSSAQLDTQVAAFREELARIYVGLTVQAFSIALVGAAFVFWVVRRHERLAHSRG